MAKITDPSKLLPSTKSTAITKIGKGSFISPIKISKKTTSITKGLIGEGSDKDTVDVNNKLVKVEKFLKSDLITSKKKAETRRKEKEREDFSEAEKKLETPKIPGFKLPKLPEPPSLGFLDRIKRFIFFTALGWALPKIIEFLPKLEGILNIIGGVYNFAEGLFGKLFDGFMSLVDFGGDLKDKTLGFIATAKAGVGGDYQKEFDKLEKQFNTFVNASIIAGVLSADIGLAAVDEYNKWRNKNKTPDGKPKPPDRKPRVTEGQGGKPPKGKPKGKPKVTGDVKPKWLDKLTGPFAKLKGPLSRFAGAVVPGLGAAVGAADAAARFKSGDKIGGTLASVSAALDVATAASALTGIGLPIAGILGTISMGIDVVLLIRDILSLIPFIPKNLLGFSRGGRLVRRYQGGGTTRGGRPVGAPPRRTIKPSRKRPLKIKPPTTEPGKDVGGKEKIKILYPDTGRRFITEKEYENWKRVTGSNVSYTQYLVDQRQSEGKRPNPYKALTNTAKILKDIPLVGGLMGAAVDIALGQKPDKQVYKTIAYGIGNLVNTLTNENVNKSISSLMSEIKGFADGGTVPSRELKGTYSSMNTGDLIAKVLEPTIGQKVNEAINSIEKELTLRVSGGAVPPGQTPPGTTTPNPGRSGSYPSGVYIGPPGDTDGEQTGLDMNLSGGIGTPIYAPRDLIYRSKGTDGNPSVGLQGTADVLGPSGSGFGYYGAYRFKEGNTEYEVLMGHFRNLPYRGAKDGDIIPKGTLLGYQGASGRTIGQGNKPYPHISLHLNGVGFQASNQKLVEFAESLVQSGGTAPPAAQTPPGQQPLNPIFQRPGQTPPAAPGQTPPTKKSGGASWYGPGFYGNRTADGTPLNRDSLWVAHKTLPFGTKVKFTYNGKTITLPVKDRGPFKPGREWDFTEAAAEAIGLKTGPYSGTGTVQYEVIGKKGGGYVTSPNGQRIREFITPGTKDKMPTILDKMPTPMEIRKKNFFEKGSIASYPSYSDGGMMIAIQPIIIEKTVPVPMRSDRGISFPVAGVNNSMGNSSSLNQG